MQKTRKAVFPGAELHLNYLKQKGILGREYLRRGAFQFGGYRSLAIFFSRLPGRSLRDFQYKVGVCGADTRKIHALRCISGSGISPLAQLATWF